MRILKIILSQMLVLATAVPAIAGIVITQQMTSSGQPGGGSTTERTVMLQGNKRKSTGAGRDIIEDLDNNVIYVIDPTQKFYLQFPFPPQGPMMAMMTQALNMSFKKTGNSRKVIGYTCEDYTSSNKTIAGESNSVMCFSTTAPGAKEFSALEKKMLDAIKAKGGTVGQMPEGIPLEIDSTTQLSAPKLPPNMPPEQAQKMKEQMAKREPIKSTTMVTKIEQSDLPPSTFEPPPGFTKREINMPGKRAMPVPSAASSPAANQ